MAIGALLVALPGTALAPPSGTLPQRSSSTVEATQASALVAPPSYYRPILFEGKAFPLARSNCLTWLEIFNNWHAPRLRLIAGRWQLVGVHLGIDILAERGTPVFAIEPGTVSARGWTFYSGNMVEVLGLDGRTYFYAHLSATAPGIAIGARVAAGRTLGAVGNTGYGPPGERDQFPPHLHLGIRVGPTWVDPFGLLDSLYDATVQADGRSQARLDSLARGGASQAWRRLAANVLMSSRPAAGE